MAARFNLDWMNKEEYKDWLLPEQTIQKQDANFAEEHFLYPIWESHL